MKTIEAVYENGVFRPIESVALPEGMRAEVIIPVATAPGGGIVEADEPRRKETPYEIMTRIASLPEPVRDDGFSGADHDKVLYGENGAA
jgi:predicted DNA-binding antitoxin AbrB/MazE fold protein